MTLNLNQQISLRFNVSKNYQLESWILKIKKKMDVKRNRMSTLNKFLMSHQLKICVMTSSTIFSMAKLQTISIPEKKRALRLKSIQYQLIHGISFRKNHDRVLFYSLEKQDTDKVLEDMHDGLVGGPFFWRYHCSQDIERWILLADIIQGCSCLFSKL
jgi:hypothetical protein